MSFEGFSAVSELDETILSLLDKLQVEQLVDLESLVCLDEKACVEVVSKLVEESLRSGEGTISPAVIMQAERWLAMLMSVSAQSYFLTPMEKYVIAKIMVIEALLLFFYAIENPLYVRKLRAIAKLFKKEDPNKAVGSLICDLFRKSTDTPDTWLSRVRNIYHLLVRSAAFATLTKIRLEGLEL